jgi:predicted RNA-binding Zn-ribbon protein involved in translation (DUF1610 family)
MSDLVVKCEVCGSLIDEEDLFCANCGTEAPRREEAGERAAAGARVSRHNFQCSGCGAAMSYDASAGSLQCPFCGSVDLREQKDAKVLAPRRVVPFQIDRGRAEAAMRRWLGRGWFRPSDLSERAAVVEMRPVYVPYWVFEARTHTHWTADSSHTPPGARGDWYPMAGEHRGSYAGLLIGASGALAPKETWDICPFDLGAGVPPEEVDLDNVTVEQFSVPRKYARPLARGSLEEAEASACAERYVPGRSRNVHANVRIESMSSEPVLLPVWIMAYRYRGDVYRFLVNGQSGRATGAAPLSWLKIVLAAAAVVVLALVLLGVIAAAASGAEVGRAPAGTGQPPPQAAAVDVSRFCYTASASTSHLAALECGDLSPLSRSAGAASGLVPLECGDLSPLSRSGETAPHLAALECGDLSPLSRSPETRRPLRSLRRGDSVFRRTGGRGEEDVGVCWESGDESPHKSEK